MYCMQCGNLVADNAMFCNVCGCQLKNNPQNSIQQTYLPRDVFYDPKGRLNWLYRDYEKDSSGNYIIRHVFEKDYIIHVDSFSNVLELRAEYKYCQWKCISASFYGRTDDGSSCQRLSSGSNETTL